MVSDVKVSREWQAGARDEARVPPPITVASRRPFHRSRAVWLGRGARQTHGAAGAAGHAREGGLRCAGARRAGGRTAPMDAAARRPDRRDAGGAGAPAPAALDPILPLNPRVK